MASPVTIQPSEIDAFITENTPTTNYGSFQSVQICAYTAARKRGFLKFDFSAVVPAGATITLATLNLYCSTALASRTITFYRLLRTDWVETEVTWNVYKTGSNWGTAGALGSGVDFTPTDAATATSVAINNWLNVTVTAQIQTALDSVAGVAHFLVADVGASQDLYNGYRSRNYVIDTTLCPKLYIEYGDAPLGPALLKTVNSLAKASVATRNGLALASIKTWNGLS